MLITSKTTLVNARKETMDIMSSKNIQKVEDLNDNKYCIKVFNPKRKEEYLFTINIHNMENRNYTSCIVVFNTYQDALDFLSTKRRLDFKVVQLTDVIELWKDMNKSVIDLTGKVMY